MDWVNRYIMQKQKLIKVIKKQLFILGIWSLGAIAGASIINWYYLLPTLKVQTVYEQMGWVNRDMMIEGKSQHETDSTSSDDELVKAQEESTRLEADSRSVQLIQETFPEDKEIAVAVAKAESGLNEKAKGYNCRYNGISQSCKNGDEGKAWSVDCGIMQVNTQGQDCPNELMEIKGNLKVAKEIKEQGGWKRWWTYRTNKHLAFL